MAKINNVIGLEVRRRLMDIEDLKHLSAEAQQRSLSAEEMAKLAELLSKSTKEELDQIVIEGDSSVEAAQARVDAKGEAHKTLKARLDSEYGEVAGGLEETGEEVNNIYKNIDENMLAADIQGIDTENIEDRKEYLPVSNKELVERYIYLDEVVEPFSPDSTRFTLTESENNYKDIDFLITNNTSRDVRVFFRLSSEEVSIPMEDGTFELLGNESDNHIFYKIPKGAQRLSVKSLLLSKDGVNEVEKGYIFRIIKGTHFSVYAIPEEEGHIIAEFMGIK